MKKAQFLKLFLTVITCILLNINYVSAQDKSPSMEAWSKLLNKSQLTEFFSDIFNTMGIVIEESNEKFTVHHKGDHFELSNGIDESAVDYLIYLELRDIANMEKYGSDAEISSDEAYRIMKTIFTPLTQASLQAPMMRKPLLRKLAGIENLIHVYLVSPDEKEITSHTLIFVNKQWIVAKGIHGQAKRTFKISPEQAVEYQKHVFRALQANKGKEWKKFKKWYKEWRKEVSVNE